MPRCGRRRAAGSRTAVSPLRIPLEGVSRLNKSFCNKCGDLVPAERAIRGEEVFLVKQCPKCGPNETMISSHADRHMSKRGLDPGFSVGRCEVECVTCDHHREPTYAFVDVTNRCNMNCPMCADSVPGHGFVFEPPLEHFEKIFQHLATFDTLPTVALFGGEPTVRDDLVDIVNLARKYGMKVRVLTNGIRLADEDYCRRLVESRAHLLVSYDGNKPECYKQLRGTDKVLPLKLKAVENLNKMRRARVSYVTCFSWGMNDKDLPEILDFYHRQHRILHGVYLMPLVQVWKPGEFDYQPKRMTTEDVEAMVADNFPGYNAKFISLGLASHFQVIAKYLKHEALPYYGTHPNCESFYLLVSDGQRYVPVDHYLKTSLPEIAEAMLELEKRLLAREERWTTSKMGRVLGALRLRNFTLRMTGLAKLMGVLRRHIAFGRAFKGNGLGKAWHILATVAELTVRCKSERVRARHMNVHHALRIVILPLEDDPILETERLERCPSVHVYYDPRTDSFNYVPVCSWRLFNKKLLKDITDHYAGVQEPAKEEAVAAGT